MLKGPLKKDRTPTVCLSGLGCGLRGMVSQRLATPSISKQNNAIASARGMKARQQEKPELKAKASGKARDWTSRDGTATTQPLLTVA